MKDLPPRPRLESRLDGAVAHRLTMLVADTGFGKTTLLSSWAAGINAVVYPVTAGDAELGRLWRHVTEALRRHLPDLPQGWAGTARGPVSAHSENVRPQAMAEVLGQALAQQLTRDLVLVLDDAHLVAQGAAASFVAGLVRHAPPLLHVVLSSRGPVPVPATRLHHQGQVLELGGAELAFTTGEVAALLRAGVGADAARQAPAIRAATGGWPIAVRLAVAALPGLPPDAGSRWLARLTTPTGQLHHLLGAIHAQEPPATRQLLATMTLFDRFPAELAGVVGLPDAAGVLAELAHRGLFVEPAGDQTDWYRLQPLAARFLTKQAALPAARARQVRQSAASWCADHGQAHTALHLLAASGDHDRVVALLANAGEQLTVSGHADVVAQAVATLPAAQRGPVTEQLAGDAAMYHGDWDGALSRYTRAAGGPGVRSPALAWRIGAIHYLRGEHDHALDTFQRADPHGPATRDLALLLSWSAAAHWARGNAPACRELATGSLQVANELGDPASLATAHTVLSMVAALEGDRRANAAHYERALAYARQAGDVLQLIRIHNNRASHNMEEGDYPPALTELETAIRLTDLHGYGAFGALALSNRAEIRLRLGQLEEAHHDITAALAQLHDLGSRKAAYPLALLGHLHRLRGDQVAAVRAYEQARDQVGSGGDRQALVTTLAGLARVLASDDPAQARALAQQALAGGEGMAYVEALLAAAQVAAVAGEPERARELARQARTVAQSRRDRAGAAEADEIEATVTADPAQARELAAAAVDRWTAIGDPIGLGRAQLVLAGRLDDPVAAAAAAEAVQERARTIGCRLLSGQADALLASLAIGADRPVRVETLGTFRVVRDATVLPAASWRSRKARELLKMLVARRSRPATRDLLMETLWPGEPPAGLANRLHVAVSTLRSTLDPDRHLDPDAFVVTDGDTIRLRLTGMDVDVESFLHDAAAGMAMLRAGRTAEALPRLALAESRYAGNFLEENLYDDWAVPVREQARAAYLEVAACLARHARKTGDVDSAARYLLRLLEHDPYDERAHLALVASLVATGRHGEARRHYRHYCARMDELEIEAAPFPSITG